MTDPSISYTAHIKINRVAKRINQDRQSSSQGSTVRDVVETLNLVIKANSFTRLQEKVAAHISIMDEEDV